MKPLFIDKKPSIRWLFFAIILTCIFILLQLPAAWIVARLAPQNTMITSISGNLWDGEANWQMPTAQTMLQGTATWHTQPWQLLLLRIGAVVDIQTGNTHLQSTLSVSKNQVYIQHLTGDIATETLKNFAPIIWPDSPIHLKDISLKYHTHAGVSDAEGQLNWNGGELSYPYEGKVEKANLPPLVGLISMDKTQFHLALTNSNKEKMGDIFLSPDNTVDIRLTQRLLLNVAGYKGNAGLDSNVVSLRQPLSSLGKM